VGTGIGLGFLFAPKSGSETRKDLKLKIDQLIENIKDLDVEDVKIKIEEKLQTIKQELEDLDKEKVAKIAKEKVEKIKEEIADLAKLAKEKATQ
jgi:gas vesicle protein